MFLLQSQNACRSKPTFLRPRVKSYIYVRLGLKGLKHFEQQHVNKKHPKRAVFLQNDEKVQLTVPQAIRSPAVQAEYKASLAGVTKRINGVPHQRHKSTKAQYDLSFLSPKNSRGK